MRQFNRTWELLVLLTLRELKLRYQDTALGFVWSLIKPLLLGAVLYLAVRRVIGIEIEDYQLFLVAGLFPWFWFQMSVLLATPAFANNGNLIKKVYFPRFVLPFSTIANNMVHFFLAIPILLVFVFTAGERPGLEWIIGIPLLATVQLALLMGIVLVVATVDVFFRDLEHLVEVLLNLWFYLTPILYPLSMVPENLKPLILINPLTPLIESWRDLFMESALPGPELLISVAFAAATLIAGGAVFQRMEGAFADAV